VNDDDRKRHLAVATELTQRMHISISSCGFLLMRDFNSISRWCLLGEAAGR